MNRGGSESESNMATIHKKCNVFVKILSAIDKKKRQFYRNIQTKLKNLKRNEVNLNEQVREETDVSYQKQNEQTERSSVDIQKAADQFTKSSKFLKQQ